MAKRKREEEYELLAAEQQAARMAARDEREVYTSQHAGGSRVEAETLGYLQEVAAHLATLQDAEERQLLVANVLEEISGKEIRIAADAVTSRLLEQLLADAPSAQLMQFLGEVADAEALYSIAGSAFGSHVMEKVLMGLHRQADSLGQEDADALEALLDRLLDALKDSLQEYIQDKHATHVARRLLVVISGKDVLPAAGGGKGPKKQHGQAAAGSLAEKLAGTQAEAGEPLAPARYPRLLSKAARLLLSAGMSGQTLEGLARNCYSGPFVQALLRAVQGDGPLLRQLLPRVMGADAPSGGAPQPGQALAALKEGHMGKLLRDTACSRLLEVAVAVAPADIAEEFYVRFLKGRLLSLASHHCANFVVQAALAAARGKEQVRALFTELEPALGELLKRRRSGVVASLVAACGRAGVCQREVCAALARAVAALPEWQSDTGNDRLARALLTLDTPAVLDGSRQQQQQDQRQQHDEEEGQWAHEQGHGGARLSTPGSALLIQLLQYPKNCCSEFAESLAALSPPSAARVARDPGGSRVAEALLGSGVPLATKHRFLRSLGGSWGSVALSAPGSYFTEKAYALGDLEQKEAIASELAASAKAIERTHWGPSLLRRVGAEAYARSPDEWRRRAQSAASTLRQFADVFGEGGGVPQAEGKNRKRKQKKLEKLQQLQQQQQQQQEGQGEQEQQQGDEGVRQEQPQQAHEQEHFERLEEQQQQQGRQKKTKRQKQQETNGHQVDAGALLPEQQSKKAKRSHGSGDTKESSSRAAAEAAAAALGGAGASAAMALLGFGLAAASPVASGKGQDGAGAEGTYGDGHGEPAKKRHSKGANDHHAALHATQQEQAAATGKAKTRKSKKKAAMP